MSDSPMSIGELRLPGALVVAMSTGRWPGPIVRQEVERVFKLSAPRPRFFTFDLMQAVNRSWRAGPGVEYVGQASSSSPPGDIDITRSVLIGELGPDQPIALDYRSITPRVVVASDDLVSPWQIVAASIEELLVELGWDRT